jgi:putative glutamine amidotransferase
MIEAIERTDKTYEMGLQFHPEAALVKHLEKAANQDKFMSYDSALKFFKALLA